MASAPALDWRPITREAFAARETPFDGAFHLVRRGGWFAVVRWTGEVWAFSSGNALDYKPTEWRP